MTAQEIRQKYFDFMVKNDHKLIARASLIPQNDPTTLFTGSGMQPLIPYLLGEPHPDGKKLVDSQTCLRAEDMDEVGDNRHTTFFEMLGNWSLGDYYKQQQLTQFWQFLTDELELDPQRLYASVFIGDSKNNIAKDCESVEIWKKLFSQKGIEAKDVELGSALEGSKKGMQGGRIFYYDANENWWSRSGPPENMPEREPGGPDSEVFYEFPAVEHDVQYGENCHPACDCGRFIEIGNSVFMAYKKTASGFEQLSKPNVDFGGGLERLAAAKNDDPDIFKISLLWPIVEALEQLSGKKYDEHQQSMRVIADHLRAAVFLVTDGATPSNKEQGYVLRRLIRRAIRFALDLGIEEDLVGKIIPTIIEVYKADFAEIANTQQQTIDTLTKEEKLFRQTLRSGVNMLTRMARDKKELTGLDMFKLYDTFGFPMELAKEEADRNDIKLHSSWEQDFRRQMEEQRQRSQTASQGMFKGGLADHSEQVVRYHTTTHLMYQALKNVLGDSVVQRGSNITVERIRFDFSHPEKVPREQLDEVEKIVNDKITEDLPVTWQEEPTQQALKTASGAFGDKYSDKVKVYTIGDPALPFSREICGGPHVEHTGQIGEGGKKFKITKEEASSAGVRRIKAVLV